MAKTKLMRADEIAASFNGATNRQYWRASVAGTRVFPEVNFNSRASMVVITYRIATDDFTLGFSKATTSFGDFLASAYRSFDQVLAGLKAGGLPFPSVIDPKSAVLRITYEPRSKIALAHLARDGDTWLDTEPAVFKEPVRENEENTNSPIDA